MEEQIRYWSGRLHPGDIVLNKGRKCLVAGDKNLGSRAVPAGHVPIYFFDVCGNCWGPLYMAPFDDIDILRRKV